MIKPAQSRAARGLLGWRQADLAVAAKVGVVTIRQFEADNTEPRSATLTVIQAAFEKAGVDFIPEDDRGFGVRLRNTTAFEDVLSLLIVIHRSTASLDRVETIARKLPAQELSALPLAFGDRLRAQKTNPNPPRGQEIQDRLIRLIKPS